jgi:hypothetical protein
MKLQIPIVPPSPSDTAPVVEGHNSCEGNDCINYDNRLPTMVVHESCNHPGPPRHREESRR